MLAEESLPPAEKKMKQLHDALERLQKKATDAGFHFCCPPASTACHCNAGYSGPKYKYKAQSGYIQPMFRLAPLAPGDERDRIWSRQIDEGLEPTSQNTSMGMMCSSIEQLNDWLVCRWEGAVCNAVIRCPGRITEVASEVSKRLVDMGRFEKAANCLEAPGADFFERIGAYKEAIDVYMRAGLCDKARAVMKQQPQCCLRRERRERREQKQGAAPGCALVYEIGTTSMALASYIEARSSDCLCHCKTACVCR